MKLGGEVKLMVSNSISAYGMAGGTFSPLQPPTHPENTPITNFGLIWMKLGEEVKLMVSNSISAYGMARGTFSPLQPPTHSENTPITNVGNLCLIWMKLGGEV